MVALAPKDAVGLLLLTTVTSAVVLAAALTVDDEGEVVGEEDPGHPLELYRQHKQKSCPAVFRVLGEVILAPIAMRVFDSVLA